MKLLQDLAAVLPRLGEPDVHKFCVFLDKYSPHLGAISSLLYERLDAADQQRLLTWFLKRWAKIDLINAVEAGLYRNKIQSVKDEPRPRVEVNGTSCLLRDFASQGYPFQLAGYDWFLGVHDIYYNQYEHKAVTLAPGDVIIDAGAFIGDTAVFFHHKLGGRCEIHSFELLDENIALLHHNLVRNGAGDGPGRVVINKVALTDVSGGEIVIAPGKTEGATSIFGTDAQGERVGTITLDDYVVQNNLTRVDFIKMDIEGAELAALTGARRTIQHFKPKLAICLYHKWDDAMTIPAFIQSTGVEYSFAFKWVQLSDGWEAVLLATPTDGTARSAAPDLASPQTDSADDLAKALVALSKAYLKKCAQADSVRRETRDPGKISPARPLAAPALAGA
jgi:FkbM family methyltransferase